MVRHSAAVGSTTSATHTNKGTLILILASISKLAREAASLPWRAGKRCGARLRRRNARFEHSNAAQKRPYVSFVDIVCLCLRESVASARNGDQCRTRSGGIQSFRQFYCVGMRDRRVGGPVRR